MSPTMAAQPGHNEGMIDRADVIIREANPCRTLRLEREPALGQSPSSQVPPRLMLLSIWFGLVTGLLELGSVCVRNHVVGWSTFSALQISRHFPWMIPLANLVLFLGWGLIVALLRLVWKRLGGRPSVFLLSFPACLALLLVFPGLYKSTYIVLAAGFAAAAARWLSAVPGRLRRLVHTSLPVLLMIACLFVVWQGVQIAWGERSAIPAPRQRERKPMNVLLLVMDTVRADHLSLYAYKRQTTPNLDRIAAARHQV